jgi:hypothetical protein
MLVGIPDNAQTTRAAKAIQRYDSSGRPTHFEFAMTPEIINDFINRRDDRLPIPAPWKSKDPKVHLSWYMAIDNGINSSMAKINAVAPSTGTPEATRNQVVEAEGKTIERLQRIKKVGLMPYAQKSFCASDPKKTSQLLKAAQQCVGLLADPKAGTMTEATFRSLAGGQA